MHVNFNVSGDSHNDHITAEHMGVLREMARDGVFEAIIVPPQAGIFIATLRLPEHLPDVLNGLRGPLSGEPPVGEGSVFYGIRGEGRPNLSRLTALPSAPTRLVTVIVGRLEERDGVWHGTLFTAYGGPCAPQEPGDPYLAPERVEASVTFWREHALSVDAGIPVQRVKTVNRATFLDPEGSRSAVEGYAYTIFSLED